MKKKQTKSQTKPLEEFYGMRLIYLKRDKETEIFKEDEIINVLIVMASESAASLPKIPTRLST